MAEGGRAASIAGSTGDFDEAVDRNVQLHGVLAPPWATTSWRLSDLVQRDASKAVIDQVLPWSKQPGHMSA